MAYAREGQIYLAPLDGNEKPKQIVAAGRNCSDPPGRLTEKLLAFMPRRGDHSFIGVYDALQRTSLKFLAPSVDQRCIRRMVAGRKAHCLRAPALPSRETRRKDTSSRRTKHIHGPSGGRRATGSAKEIWHSSATPQGSFPYMADDTGGGVINWAADNQLLIASEEDGWQHLYALSVDGGTPKLLTPGKCEVEQWSFTPDKKTILFNSNCGDIDRRHLWTVAVAGAHLEPHGKRKRMEPRRARGWSESSTLRQAQRQRSRFHSTLADPRRCKQALIPHPQDFPTDCSSTPSKPFSNPPTTWKSMASSSSPKMQSPAKSFPRSFSFTAAPCARCCSAGITCTTTRIPTR